LLVALLLLPAAVGAQRAGAGTRPPRLRAEFRLDAILARDNGAQIGGGLIAAPQYNVRMAAIAAVGGVRRADGGVQPAGRVDLVGRWLTDPFRQSRRAIQAGGGIGLLFAQGAAPRPVAIVTVGVEGKGDGPWVPGVEVGLGGGVRLGVTLRRASPRSR
jgi:hypothetical protein